MTGQESFQSPDLNYSSQYYDAVYPNYQKQNPPHKYQHYLETLCTFKPTPNTLLDFGCANGSFLKAAQAHFSWCTLAGTDINNSIDEARQQLPNANIQYGGQHALATLPTSDVITAWDVLEHIPALEETLQLLAAQLNPQGILVAVMPVYDGPLGPVVHFLDKDPTHVHRCSRQFWLSTLSKYFDIIHWHGILRYLLPNGYYLHLPLQNLMRHITPAILVVAQKR